MIAILMVLGWTLCLESFLIPTAVGKNASGEIEKGLSDGAHDLKLVLRKRLLLETGAKKGRKRAYPLEVVLNSDQEENTRIEDRRHSAKKQGGAGGGKKGGGGNGNGGGKDDPGDGEGEGAMSDIIDNGNGEDSNSDDNEGLDDTTKRSEIRFSRKIDFSSSVSSDVQLPLDENDFPITRNLAEVLRATNCHSVTMQDDYEVTQSVEEMIRHVGGTPPHAPSLTFWPFFNEVVKYAEIRRSNISDLASTVFPSWRLPRLWQDWTVSEVCEAVHDEFPGLNQAIMLISFLASSEGIEIDNDIIPQRCEQQFLHGPVMLANLNTWTVDMVAPTNFAAKFYGGRARPEEVAWSIRCSIEYVSGCEQTYLFDLASLSVPVDIVDSIQNMNLQRLEDFSLYDEGSPPHPSWPAMHSAASNISLWLAVVANLTTDQLLEAKKTDFAVAWARTVAGVHYRDDNIAGLDMGQEIVARELPRYLASKYGADALKVKEKVERMRFSWNNTAVELLGSI